MPARAVHTAPAGTLIWNCAKRVDRRHGISPFNPSSADLFHMTGLAGISVPPTWPVAAIASPLRRNPLTKERAPGMGWNGEVCTVAAIGAPEKKQSLLLASNAARPGTPPFQISDPNGCGTAVNVEYNAPKAPSVIPTVAGAKI